MLCYVFGFFALRQLEIIVYIFYIYTVCERVQCVNLIVFKCRLKEEWIKGMMQSADLTDAVFCFFFFFFIWSTQERRTAENPVEDPRYITKV